MTIHITKANVHARKWLLICIGNPRCHVPARGVRVIRMCRVGNQLYPDDYRVIACLCKEHAIKEEVPILVNEEDQREEDEAIVEAGAPELYHPYQLTGYYQKALVLQDAFHKMMNE